MQRRLRQQLDEQEDSHRSRWQNGPATARGLIARKDYGRIARARLGGWTWLA